MTLTNQPYRIKRNLLQLIIIFAVLQLLIAFLTDGMIFAHDEAMWHYIGRNWFRHGLVPYRGGVDNKSPLVFILFGISDWLFGVNYWFPRILGTVIECIGLYFVFKTARYFAGAKPLSLSNDRSEQAGLLAVTIYGLSLLWRNTGGKYVSFTETYEMTCIVAAFYWAMAVTKRGHALVSGLFAGLGFCFNVFAFFGIAAIGISSLQKKFADAIAFSIGVLTSIALMALIISLSGIHLQDVFIYGFKDNVGPGSPTDISLSGKLENFENGFFYSELILLYPAAIAYFLIVKKIDAIAIWLICSFIGINLLGIYARPHFKHLLPALSLMNALSVIYLVDKYHLPFKQVKIIIWICFFPKVFEPLFGVKKLFFGTAGKPSTDICGQTYEYSKKKLGLWVRANTTEQERVLVAGHGAQVQVYSERLSPTIFFNITQTARAKKIFVAEVGSNKPGMILIPVTGDYNKNVNQDIRMFLDTLVEKNYDRDTCMYGYAIYRLKMVNK